MAKAKKTTAAPKTAPEAKTAAARKKAPVAKAAPAAKAAAAVKSPSPAPAKKSHEIKALKPGGLEKKYVKQGSVCSVTFVLPKDAAPDAGSVAILGEFNNWSPDVHQLARREEGDFVITLELEAGRAYRFRYVIDGWKFENDWFADRYEPNPYGGEDSVVDV
jgi:1,4-alpha-glucan branching enzyme